MGTSKVGAISKRAVFKPVKVGIFGFFENPVCCKISNKLKEGPFADKKNSNFLIFEKKTKNENLNSLIVPKYIKRETFWDFWHFSLQQNIKKI